MVVMTQEAERKSRHSRNQKRAFRVGFSSAVPTSVINIATELSSKLSAIASDFWNTPVSIKLNALSLKNLYYWRNDPFYVSQLPLGEAGAVHADKILQLRISDTACAGLLKQSLGEPEGTDSSEFQVQRITKLESEILTEFSKEIFVCLLKGMVNRKAPIQSDYPLVHLVWGLRVLSSENEDPSTSSVPNDDQTGKIILTLPLENIRYPKAKGDTGLLGDTLFLDAHTEGTLWLGKTRFTIDDLRELERGDIVILDHSQVNQMALLTPKTGEPLFFNTEFKNRNSLEIPVTPEESTQSLAPSSMKEHTMNSQKISPSGDQIWDSLTLEVNAEFFPTRLPLHQLKQMSEGLILEVGDLTQNDIRLHIEGKTVALGELVIVGEKFGVRIKEVKDKAESESDEPLPAITTQPDETAHPLESDLPLQETVSQQTASEPESNDNDDEDWMNDDFGDDEDEW